MGGIVFDGRGGRFEKNCRMEGIPPHALPLWETLSPGILSHTKSIYFAFTSRINLPYLRLIVDGLVVIGKFLEPGKLPETRLPQLLVNF